MKRAAILSAVLSISLVAFAAQSFGAQKPPYEIVRSLHALQDQMVLGNRAARSAMPIFSAQLGQKLLGANPTVWREPRNARAAVTYVLSGGMPRVARKVLDSGYCPNAEKPLLEGALAYLEGHAGKAKSLLGNVDPRALEPILGGHIALVQAALAAPEDAAEAIRLLDLARVLAPGTLVEEAALRREIFLLNATGDFDKFVSMSGEYVRRFIRSAYADNFRLHFSEAVSRLDIAGSPEQLSELDDLLAALSPNDQLSFYLLIARSSIINGKIGIARFAAGKAKHLARLDSIDANRAQLYEGTASIMTSGDYAEGLAELESLEAAHLSEDDSLLRQAALSLAEQIRQWPEAEQSPGGGEGSVPAALTAPMTASNTSIALAQKDLADSEALLKGRRP